jgi:hypothetical protein
VPGTQMRRYSRAALRRLSRLLRGGDMRDMQ